MSNNDYIGMSDAELDNIMLALNSSKRIANNTIAEYKQKIKECQKNIAKLDKQLLQVEKARVYVKNIELCNIIHIYKHNESKYIGPEKGRSFYLSSDWKNFVAYSFIVEECNSQDNTKSRRCIYNSGKYTNDEKHTFNEQLIMCMKEYNVGTIILHNGVKINTTIVQKANPNIKICNN